MHYCNLCPSRTAFLPPAQEVRQTAHRNDRHPWQISTRLQRQRRQSAGQASHRSTRLSNFNYMTVLWLVDCCTSGLDREMVSRWGKHLGNSAWPSLCRLAGVNRHITRCTSPTSVVLRCKMMVKETTVSAALYGRVQFEKHFTLLLKWQLYY